MFQRIGEEIARQRRDPALSLSPSPARMRKAIKSSGPILATSPSSGTAKPPPPPARRVRRSMSALRLARLRVWRSCSTARSRPSTSVRSNPDKKMLCRDDRSAYCRERRQLVAHFVGLAIPRCCEASPLRRFCGRRRVRDWSAHSDGECHVDGLGSFTFRHFKTAGSVICSV